MTSDLELKDYKNLIKSTCSCLQLQLAKSKVQTDDE